MAIQATLPGVTDDAAAAAVARLYGEPLFAFPDDLYIPPDALKVFLEVFEGPLDLLLYLIRRQDFDILDIPMVELTAQYLAYVEQVRQHNLELAADYLLMAALLIAIKARMLLPQSPADSEEEPEDPRAELVRRLLEYERIKQAAAGLDELPQRGRDFLAARAHVQQTLAPRLPQVHAADLQAAWQRLLRRAQLQQRHTITREQLSVRDTMSQVLRQLRGQQFVAFEDLFDPARGIPVLVVTLVALLELAHEQMVEVTQAAPYAPIYVRLASAPAAA